MKKSAVDHPRSGRRAVEAEFRFPKRFRVVPREQRHRARPGEAHLRNCKVRVSIYLDGDVIQYFKERAAAPGAPPYQTQINAALRRIIEAGEAWPDSAGAKSLLGNEQFIEALARQVGKRLAFGRADRA
ncbi:MAG: BrnA antitoxin family protein [Acidobacteria bacterium]|nr:BrnA antitoxin family protein [Acidobacteriota bacterium]